MDFDYLVTLIFSLSIDCLILFSQALVLKDTELSAKVNELNRSYNANLAEMRSLLTSQRKVREDNFFGHCLSLHNPSVLYPLTDFWTIYFCPCKLSVLRDIRDIFTTVLNFFRSATSGKAKWKH